MVKSHVRGRARVDKGKTLRLTRKRDVLLAFTTVSLPLLAIALILIGLIFNASERERPDLSVGTDQLPIIPYDTSGLYYTGTSPGSFLLLGSWASNIATICVAPFMIIFSYAVAREILQESTKDRTMSNSHPTYLKEMMRGDYGMLILDDTAPFPISAATRETFLTERRAIDRSQQVSACKADTLDLNSGTVAMGKTPDT